MPASTSACALWAISSMRPGWMRPSAMSRSSASRATSRRTGSKHDTTTVSGVSSMMTSTPVALLQRARPLIGLLLPPLELAAPARRLLLRSLARQEQLLLRREHDALLRLLQPLALGRRRSRHGLRHPALDAPSQDIEGRSRSGGAAQEGEEHARPCAHGTYLRQHPAGK